MNSNLFYIMINDVFDIIYYRFEGRKRQCRSARDGGFSLSLSLSLSCFIILSSITGKYQGVRRLRSKNVSFIFDSIVNESLTQFLVQAKDVYDDKKCKTGREKDSCNIINFVPIRGSFVPINVTIN